MTQRSGNFDLMRLVAAFMIFFAVSGYLNAQSVFRSRSAVYFLTSRAFRIFPALVVCVAFCVVLGACVTTHDLIGYLAPGDGGVLARDAPLTFLWRNSTLVFGVRHELAGVFEANVYPRAVNGSLWTLPIETYLYLLLAVAAVFCRFKPIIFAAIVIVGLIGLVLFGAAWSLEPLLNGKYAAIFAIIFLSGAAFAMVEQQLGLIPASSILSLLSFCLFVEGNANAGFLLVLVVACIVLNEVPLPVWLRPTRDISYGVYFYAFPVQQLTSSWSSSFWVRLCVVVAIVTVLASLSAKYVEQPALRMRKRLGATRYASGVRTATVNAVS